MQIATGRPWTWTEIAAVIGKSSPLLLSFLLLLQTLFHLNSRMGKMVAFYDRKGGPTVVESEKKIETPDPEASCPICTDLVGTENQEGTTETWSELPCGHRFGSHCIKHYLGIVADNRPTCPICRQKAYHSCGHPVLPMPCVGTVSKLKKATTKHKTALGDLGWKSCGYCDQARVQAGYMVKRSRLWRPFRYIADALNPRRRRENRRQAPQYPPYVPGLWGQPDLARARDSGWERWWKAQAPQEV